LCTLHGLTTLEEGVEMIMWVLNLQAMKAVLLDEVDYARAKARWISGYCREKDGSLGIISTRNMKVTESARHISAIVVEVVEVC
jgi:hypothetical protein